MGESKRQVFRSRWAYAIAVLTLAGVIAAPALVSAQSSAHGDDQMFTALPICTVIDTRNWTPADFGGDTKPQANTTYTFDIRGEAQDFSAQGGAAAGCGVPNSADVVLLNILAVNPDGGGNMKAFAKDQSPGDVSGTVINFNALNPNVNLNNAVTVLMDASTDDGDINIRPQGSATHIIGTVLGYYQNTTDGFYTEGESNDRFSIENAIAESFGDNTPVASGAAVMLGSVNVTVPDRCSLLFGENWDFEVHATGYLTGSASGSDSILWLEDSDTSGNNTWIIDPDPSTRGSFAVHDLFVEGGSGTKTFELWADNEAAANIAVSWQLTAEAKDVRCNIIIFSSDGEEPSGEPEGEREPDRPNPRDLATP